MGVGPSSETPDDASSTAKQEALLKKALEEQEEERKKEKIKLCLELREEEKEREEFRKANKDLETKFRDSIRVEQQAAFSRLKLKEEEDRKKQREWDSSLDEVVAQAAVSDKKSKWICEQQAGPSFVPAINVLSSKNIVPLDGFELTEHGYRKKQREWDPSLPKYKAQGAMEECPLRFTKNYITAQSSYSDSDDDNNDPFMLSKSKQIENNAIYDRSNLRKGEFIRETSVGMVKRFYRPFESQPTLIPTKPSTSQYFVNIHLENPDLTSFQKSLANFCEEVRCFCKSRFKEMEFEKNDPDEAIAIRNFMKIESDILNFQMKTAMEIVGNENQSLCNDIFTSIKSKETERIINKCEENLRKTVRELRERLEEIVQFLDDEDSEISQIDFLPKLAYLILSFQNDSLILFPFSYDNEEYKALTWIFQLQYFIKEKLMNSFYRSHFRDCAYGEAGRFY